MMLVGRVVRWATATCLSRTSRNPSQLIASEFPSEFPSMATQSEVA